MYLLIFATSCSEIVFILEIMGRYMIKNVHRSSCKVPLFLSDFNEFWIFLNRYGDSKLI
jgi:hypothetical protein